MTLANHDVMKEYIIDQFKGRELELIQQMPFLVGDLKSNITAEIRDWIIENEPQYTVQIPSCYITENHKTKYFINMLKNGNTSLLNNSKFLSNVNYQQLVILMESGILYSHWLNKLSERDKKRFFSAVLKMMKRKKLSESFLLDIRYAFGNEILDAFMNTKFLSETLAHNLFTFITFNTGSGYKGYEKYNDLIHSLYFLHEGYREQIDKSDLPQFFEFKYSLFKTGHYSSFNIVNITNGKDVYTKHQLKYNMSDTFKFFLQKEGKLNVYFKKEGVVTIYKQGYLKDKLFKKFQNYIKAIVELNLVMNYVKFKSEQLKGV